MNIHEYQSKEILRKFQVPTSTGIVILDKESINTEIDSFEAPLYVVKAQIHAGGRGKGGGVKVVKTKEEAKQAALKMYGMNLITPQTGPEGQKVKRIYVESGSNIKKELYFSIAIDRSLGCVVLIASKEGGIDIEEVAHNNPELIIKVSIDPAFGLQSYHLNKIAYGLDLKDVQAKEMMKIVKGCYEAFIQTDANQIEINPLIINDQDKLLALDAKINFDDNALFRHPELASLRDTDEEEKLETEAANNDLNYVKMDGNIGCMVNGAGLAMATMDIIKLYGGSPANFLDVGGGTTQERVEKAFNIILSDPSVKGILVNIFGGIVKCDLIAEGIIAAAKTIQLQIPVVVRLEGTNFELGTKILNDSGLNIITAKNLADAAEKIVSAIR